MCKTKETVEHFLFICKENNLIDIRNTMLMNIENIYIENDLFWVWTDQMNDCLFPKKVNLNLRIRILKEVVTYVIKSKRNV